MNKEILDNYGVRFNLRITDTDKIIEVTSNSIPEFSGYFLQCFPEFLINEIIPEIDKALSGLNFDPDGGGVLCSLTIGEVTSTIMDIYNPNYTSSILTADLKQIMLSYVEWITNNRYESYL